MKSFTRRFIICLAPIIVGLGVVAWAYFYHGFRLGVDLSGGTILVYEVDKTKMPEGGFKSEDLAAALKRRIDPADLYQVTIRPIPADPPRVEIIIPTSTSGQREAREEAWDKLIQAVDEKYPVEGKENPYADIDPGDTKTLAARILNLHTDTRPDPKAVADFIRDKYSIGQGKRRLTGEEIENIKNLISQQGRLEFKILANFNDDHDAIARAEAYFQDMSKEAKEDLDNRATLGEPPPPPRQEDGTPTFPVEIGGEVRQHSYSWVEVGKAQLYSFRLDSEDLANNPALQKQVEEDRGHYDTDKKEYAPGKPFRLGGALIYTRVIPNPLRIPPKDRALGKKFEYFVLVRNPWGTTEKERDQHAITGDDLQTAFQDYDNRGRLAVGFIFNTTGGNRFWDLTTRNKPDPSGFERRLAVILDGQVQTAPALNEPIRTRGIIRGEFSKQEIEDYVRILRAGALPATLKPNPVSENSMGATLGEDTIKKGSWSILFAFLAVLLFMIWYYRFAGGVASVALLANLVLTIAAMVLVQATFTLPGLAGLVLTLGIAVDSNILIYERIREERGRGASLALAIRNGYDRSFRTILDTHLTSIFTAIVLIVVGNDQLKGFGYTLTGGLIISLFTALYVTRTIFEYGLARGWLTDLRFHQMFRRPNIDFMRIRKQWFTATSALTLLGITLFVYRLDHGGLNIDFVGGTAYTARLNQPMTLEDLRKDLDTRQIQPETVTQVNQVLPPEDKVADARDLRQKLGDLSIELVYPGLGPHTGGSTLFAVRTTWQSAPGVQAFVNRRLGPNLKRIEMAEAKMDVIDTGEQKGKAKGATLSFVNPDSKEKEPDYASRAQVTRILRDQFKDKGITVSSFRLDPGPQAKEQDGRYSQLALVLSEPVDAGKLKTALAAAQEQFLNSPQPERLENFDAQLAADTQQRALWAILASWVAILLYLWFRFGNWTFGLACVVCLLHDVLFTLGLIAASYYVRYYVPFLGSILLLDDFKIDLTAVAALLTLVGYSVNDTIVVFDRIREVRGKNPLLTPQMINDSVNQTLSRTVLSSLTVLLVILVLYIFGGEGIHLFAFVMMLGVVVGTYSSIYIASPLLLMLGEGAPPKEARPAPRPAAAKT
jgi:SecD/SecF fusion protein